MSTHPQLINNYMNQSDAPDETEFFFHPHVYEDGVGWFLDQFPKTNRDLTLRGKSLFGGIRYEKTASYFESSLSMRYIKAMDPQMKLIVINRDPVDRAFSWYQVRTIN